eukprot:gene23753-biopygen9611
MWKFPQVMWKTNGKGHLKVWEGWGAAVSDEMLSHGVGGGIRHLAGSRNMKWVVPICAYQTHIRAPAVLCPRFGQVGVFRMRPRGVAGHLRMVLSGLEWA